MIEEKYFTLNQAEFTDASFVMHLRFSTSCKGLVI